MLALTYICKMKAFLLACILLAAIVFSPLSTCTARELSERDLSATKSPGPDPGKVPFNCGRGQRYCVVSKPPTPTPCSPYKPSVSTITDNVYVSAGRVVPKSDQVLVALRLLWISGWVLTCCGSECNVLYTMLFGAYRFQSPCSRLPASPEVYMLSPNSAASQQQQCSRPEERGENTKKQEKGQAEDRGDREERKHINKGRQPFAESQERRRKKKGSADQSLLEHEQQLHSLTNRYSNSTSSGRPDNKSSEEDKMLESCSFGGSGEEALVPSKTEKLNPIQCEESSSHGQTREDLKQIPRASAKVFFFLTYTW
ncbi:hypothetical protein NC651_037353 [Populus alba x Populus x berolinensis]|nr:hypothetical protein NC651_037353 [Populus alba x Populus x berolinensis]